MTFKSDTKFNEKLTCGFKCDMRNFANFHPTTQKSENFTLMGSFCQKYIRFELEKYRGVTFHDIEQWCKIWRNPDLVVSKEAWGIGWTFIRVLKCLKNCTLMEFFCQKHVMFQLENVGGIMSHDTEDCCKVWRKTESWFQKWHEELGEFSCEQSKVWKFALWYAIFVNKI